MAEAAGSIRTLQGPARRPERERGKGEEEKGGREGMGGKERECEGRRERKGEKDHLRGEFINML